MMPESGQHWRIEDLDFQALDRAAVGDDEVLFFLLVIASFIESGSDVYTRNLVGHFQHCPEAADWLAHHWEQEELQHGRALRTYVETVWPDYPWQAAFDSFFVEYGPSCSEEHLEADPALELAARCVVETGTSGYYRVLFESVREPVLRQLLDHIRQDEVRHYKYFYRFFRLHEQQQPRSRTRVGLSMARRAREILRDDGWCAYRHAHAFRYPGRPASREAYHAIRRQIRELAGEHFPARMTAEMLLTPLHVPALVRPSLVSLLSTGIQLAM